MGVCTVDEIVVVEVPMVVWESNTRWKRLVVMEEPIKEFEETDTLRGEE